MEEKPTSACCPRASDSCARLPRQERANGGRGEITDAPLLGLPVGGWGLPLPVSGPASYLDPFVFLPAPRSRQAEEDYSCGPLPARRAPVALPDGKWGRDNVGPAPERSQVLTGLLQRRRGARFLCRYHPACFSAEHVSCSRLAAVARLVQVQHYILFGWTYEPVEKLKRLIYYGRKILFGS